MHPITTHLTALLVALIAYFAPPQWSCHAQDTIPDPELRIAVRRALGLRGTGDVPPEALLDLTHLSASSSRWESFDDDDGDGEYEPTTIDRLDGLEHATNLKSLKLTKGSRYKHDLKTIDPIAGSTSLTAVTLQDAIDESHPSYARSIATTLAALPSLTDLELWGTPLDPTTVSVLAQAEGLQHLRLGLTNLADISPLSNLTRLESLDVSRNPLTDLSPLAKLQRLTSLTTGGIPINSLPALRNLTGLVATAETDFAPLARCPSITDIRFYAWGSKVLDLTPLANLHDIQTLGAPLSTNATTGIPHPLDLNSDFESLVQSPFLPEATVPDGKLRAQNRTLGRLWINGLLSIEGIGEFGSLTELSATAGWITDLSPLATSPPPELNLSGNYITDVSPLAGHTFFELDLTGNPIDFDTVPEAWKTDRRISLPQFGLLDPTETIPDPGLRTAVRQAIGTRPGDPIDAAALQNLVWLYAENLDIRSLDGLELATNLRGAALRNNIIKDLTPLAALPSLQWLRVSGNPLAALASQTVGSLRASGTRIDDNDAGRFLSAITPVDGVVYASGYQLPSVRYLDLFTELTEVFLSDNYLTDIAPVAALTGLEKVHLDGNLLSPERDPTARANLDSLSTAGAEVIIEPQRPEAQDGEIVIPDPALRRLIAPQIEIDKPYDPVAYSPAQLGSITTLDWEGAYGSASPIDDITGIASMTNLTFLSLEGAGISDISFLSGLTKLQTLDLDRNRITDLSPIAGLTALVELDVNDNQVTSVEPLAGLTDLELLDLDQNNITDITPLATLTKLRVLDVHENRITDISTLAALSSLEELNLFDNRVADITPLVGLPLTFLDIRLNQLDLTSEGTRAAVQSLKLILPNGEFYYLAQFHPELSVSREGHELVISFTGDPGVEYRLMKAEPALDDFSKTASIMVPTNELRQKIEFRLPIENRHDIYRIKYE